MSHLFFWRMRVNDPFYKKLKLQVKLGAYLDFFPVLFIFLLPHVRTSRGAQGYYFYNFMLCPLLLMVFYGSINLFLGRFQLDTR